MDKEIIRIEAGDKTIELKVSATRLAFNNFISGLAWGVGSVLGATLVVSMIIYTLGLLHTAPIIGSYITNILNNIHLK